MEVETDRNLGVKPVEQAGYFQVPGAHLYTVLHEVPDPVARVLLVGPFGPERNSSYTPWVRWARYLAARGIECLRYDYRGVGESTGIFEEMSFGHWSEDIELLAHWLKSRTPGVPLVLHGLELGALLASQAFAANLGDALLLWSPPKSAHELLRAGLLRRIALDNMSKDGNERKQTADYLRQLETEPVEVEGYRWSGRLWREALQLELPADVEQDNAAAPARSRPVKMVRLDKDTDPLINGSMYISTNPDLGDLFADNFGWIATALASKLGDR